MVQSELLEAIARVSATPDAANRQAFYAALMPSLLFVAASDVPVEWTRGAVVLEQAKKLTFLSTAAPGGGTALLAFTSRAEVVRRAPTMASFAMEARAVLELAQSSGFAGLVINPAGPWAGIPASEIAGLLS